MNEKPPEVDPKLEPEAEKPPPKWMTQGKWLFAQGHGTNRRARRAAKAKKRQKRGN